jgi:hypothetical protein
MNIKTTSSYPFLITFLVLLLTGCGGGGGGSGGSGGGGGGVNATGTGSVGIALTDKPANMSEIDKILISITAVEIFGDDDGKVTLYSGRPRGPFDLLKLEHESRPLAFGPDVPAGTYCKIRLTLNDLELVFNNGDQNFHPKLPGNNKLDLNPQKCFYVAPGSKVYLQLDMDAKSIHIVQTGNKKHYNFRPVVFIDVIQRDFPAKLVRLEDGVIREINREKGTLLLCEFSYGEGARGEFDDCMTILISRDTSAFDNIDNDGINDVSGGDAIPLTELLVPERRGNRPVTVVGRFSEYDHDDHDYPVVDALVVELGGFLDLDGTVASGASDIRFNMNVDPSEGIQTEGALPVALQPAPVGGNGTKILSRSGEPLSSTEIIPSRQVMVDGVLILSDPDFLNSSLVIVDTSDDTGKEEASGIIERVGADSLLLAADSFPCESGVGSFIVSFNTHTVVYLSTKTGGRFVDTSSLAPRQEVDISGSCEGTTLAARTIIIRED